LSGRDQQMSLSASIYCQSVLILHGKAQLWEKLNQYIL